MKHIILFLFTFLMTFSAHSEIASCDNTYQRKLRHGTGYKLTDAYHNKQSFRHNVAGGDVMIDESVSGDINGGQNPVFGWTPSLVAQNFVILPKQSMTILSSATDYAVIHYPKNRDDKLLFQYKFDIQGQNPDGSWTKPTVHVDCIYYTITRCGDGVVDDENGEGCDSGDENGEAGKCNKLCTGR